MLSIGTQFEYFDAVWVKNEWARFLDMMKEDRSKVLIPCYKGIDAYDMPREFKNLQAQDMGKLGWLQDLTRGVMKLCQKDGSQSEQTTTSVKQYSSPTVDIEAIEDNQPQMLSFIRGTLSAFGCPKKTQTQMAPCAEDVFVNISSYAYPPTRGKGRYAWNSGTTECHSPSPVRSAGAARPSPPASRGSPAGSMRPKGRRVRGRKTSPGSCPGCPWLGPAAS